MIGYNDLASKYPKLAKEWNVERNLDLTPESVTPGSNKNVWWKCSKCGHEWQARVAHRALRNVGCPVCANQVTVAGINDLVTTRPDLAAEWDYEKNTDIAPTEISAGSARKVWWKCSTCGYSWRTTIVHRSDRGDRCPACANLVVFKGKNDLATQFPCIAAEWDYEKNEIGAPSEIVSHSDKKIWWKCSTCGFSWRASINHRTERKQNCPACSNHAVFSGVNDLGTTHPELASEWDQEKNGSLKPSDVVSGTNEKVWWRCSICGNRWQSTVVNRVKGRGCPACRAMMKKSTADIALNRYIGEVVKTEGHHHESFLGTMELDVYVPEIRLAVEYDGPRHNVKNDRDNRKNRLCTENGIELIRIREDGNPETEGCTVIWVPRGGTPGYYKAFDDAIRTVIGIIGSRLNKQISVDVDTKRDWLEFDVIKHATATANSIRKKHPELIPEISDRNVHHEFIPNLPSGSNQVIWWVCSTCGHEWSSQICTRTSGGGCGVCAGKIVKKGYNDLATKYPELVEEWNLERNGDLKPDGVTVGSGKLVWWTCKTCGHIWRTSISHRTISGYGCPKCGIIICQEKSNKRRIANRGSLFDNNPEIALDWDIEGNQGMTPKDVTAGSGKIVAWKCHICGHRWKEMVNGRGPCPVCKGNKSYVPLERFF
ncbi:zinc-ribbon domain-containing protein [Methanomethylophilus alvi]|uniref:zinc-ribbon domain-containing protein n=1 Tax=Methanomethylophilus alvi TaxID=1291540 RepID=UPI0037DD6D69